MKLLTEFDVGGYTITKPNYFTRNYASDDDWNSNLAIVNSLNHLHNLSSCSCVYSCSCKELDESGGNVDDFQWTDVSWVDNLVKNLVLKSNSTTVEHQTIEFSRDCSENILYSSPTKKQFGGELKTMPSATLVGSGAGGNSQHLIPSNEDCGIRDVWCHNLEEEFRAIRQVVQKYNYVAMDTEFPGVVARPIGEFRSTADYQYQLLRCNVDLLRIIQLGLTFLDENGKTPGGSYTTWQFNFKFNLSEDMYAQDSIDLLQNSGIQFKKHEEEGIDPLDFAELLMTSGVVLMDNIKWLSFHSGYDFGYLIKLLTDQNLPHEECEFFDLLRLYFPTIYDVKYLMKSCKNLKGGLQEVADQLDLSRVGPQHQAGSDSLLTGMAFFKMKEMFFEDNIDDSKYRGHLYGLGTSFIMNGSFHDNGDNSSSS